MSRRILIAILAVTTLAVLVFAAPLAVGARRVYRDDARTRLERTAHAAAASLAAQLARTGSAGVELPDDDGVDLAAYDVRGRLLDGGGPDPGDALVLAALDGRVGDETTSSHLVVAVPVNDEDQVTGAVRATIAVSAADARAGRAWLLMAALAAAVLGIAAAAGAVLARRITRPIDRLAAVARTLGDGDFTVSPPPTGIDELDDVGNALTATAQRLGATLERERAFSADASHQLRTPLTAMKVRLEAATLGADPHDAITSALRELERLDTTVTELLALARERHHTGEPTDVRSVLDEAQQRWHGLLAAEGRRLQVNYEADLAPVDAAPEAFRHALDVLLDNARAHGRGTVVIAARSSGAAIAIDVTDEGPGPPNPDQLFQRRSPGAAGTGIGLAMARSLVEAEAGRLVASGGPRFTILLPTHPHERQGTSDLNAR